MVEDDRATSNALRRIFLRKGWDVVHATTVAEALTLLDPRPDCVILDLMLPDGDGTAVLQAIRSHHLPIRVAVTTGASDPIRLKAVAQLGPEVLLRKPIDLADLLRGLGIAS